MHVRCVCNCNTTSVASLTVTLKSVTVNAVTDPDFCLAGTKLNNLMKQRGGEQLMPLEKADEIKGMSIVCM
jgi:hypothetical protein